MKNSIASLSLDLDNKWSYMKTHGDAGWETFPSYLETLVPRVLNFLKERNLKITFFVVGQDAALDKNKNALARLSAAGHEIGNHSFNHEPWLHLYTPQAIEDELTRAEEAIEAATGKRPRGFRGPGFSLSKTVLETLARRGYEYDCSTFPTYVAPLARAFYFMTAKKMTEEERNQRKQLFGKLSDGFQSLKPYQWELSEGKNLLEIPVTTFPLFKTPIHASYVLYLSSFSRLAARAYWRTALQACKLAGVQPSILLHPLDFLSVEDAPELKFFPAMNLPLERKLETMSDICDALAANFRVVNMREHSQQVAAAKVATVKALRLAQ
jgi:peptidoglycan-N-acetylglucosamine deacetylase